MCGIFCALKVKGYFSETDFQRFARLTDVVQHRGPDAFDYKVFDLRNGRVGALDRFDLFLGHRRLSILDLSDAGCQPMRGQADTWIAFNGEIYNYLELKDELKDRYNFSNSTDTEAILAVYETLGEAGFSRFNGDWAFVIADLPRRRIVISRDRFSIKPLYFFQQSDELFFASEIKQLLPVMNGLDVNRDVMMVYLNQGLLDYSQETFFSGIRRFPTKSFAVVESGQTEMRVGKYWDYPSSQREQNWDDAVVEFRELLIDSVSIRLRSDVKVGSLVSGGLDSSTLTVIANSLLAGGIQTYSVIPLDPRFSEAKFVNALEHKTGIANRKLFLDLSRVIDVMERAIRASDEPPGGFSALAHFAMMEKIKSETDLTVILSGQGADESLMGYLKYYFFYLQTLFRNRSFLRLGQELLGSLVNRTGLVGVNLGEAARYLPGSRLQIHSYLLPPSPVIPIFSFRELRNRQIADIDHYSVPNLTHYEDRNAGAFGLEVRLPFLDHRLVELCLWLPDDFKIRYGWSKYILRESITATPGANRWRRDKKGFSLPESFWLKSELTEFIRRLFSNSTLGRMGIIDDRQFLDYYEAFKGGQKSIWYTDISRAVMAEIWTQMHFTQGDQSELSASASRALAI
jgi:asparagine synthase (glutamine-hydrolysing)